MFLEEKSLAPPPVEAKPDIYSLSTFADWAEKQPPDEAYRFNDCTGECAIGQYMAAHGIGWRDNSHGSSYLDFIQRVWRETDVNLNSLACARPWTFGALADRVKAKL